MHHSTYAPKAPSAYVLNQGWLHQLATMTPRHAAARSSQRLGFPPPPHCHAEHPTVLLSAAPPFLLQYINIIHNFLVMYCHLFIECTLSQGWTTLHAHACQRVPLVTELLVLVSMTVQTGHSSTTDAKLKQLNHQRHSLTGVCMQWPNLDPSIDCLWIILVNWCVAMATKVTQLAVPMSVRLYLP